MRNSGHDRREDEPGGMAPEGSGPEREAGTALSGFFPDRAAVALTVSRTTDRSAQSDEDVDRWIRKQRESPSLRAEVVPLDRTAGWNIDSATGNISHASGRFFSITGVAVRHRTGADELEWDQPMIDQPEIGILGILAKRIGGVLHFCLQAKEEPGTVHSVQLSTTVQATYSNYTRVHGGALPAFVHYFLDPPKERILFAKLQTEDGGRFLFKSNRNMIVLVEDHDLTTLPEGFIWLTLRQISRLVRTDNLIHACCRSVLAGVFSGAMPGGSGRVGAPERTVPSSDTRRTWSDYAGVVQWIDDRKTGNHISQKRVSLNSLHDWHADEHGHFVHRRKRYFRIIGLRVSSGNREVGSWCQPILDNVAPGIIGMLVRNGKNGMEYLLQTKAEPGNRSIVQIGPTVQFTQENYLGNEQAQKPFLFDEFQNPREFIPLAESRQSEEGARFFREEHVHRVLMLPPHRTLDLPPDYRWLTADQMRFLMHLGEQVNSCCRSILACLL